MFCYFKMMFEVCIDVEGMTGIQDRYQVLYDPHRQNRGNSGADSDNFDGGDVSESYSICSICVLSSSKGSPPERRISLTSGCCCRYVYPSSRLCRLMAIFYDDHSFSRAETNTWHSSWPPGKVLCRGICAPDCEPG